MPRRSTKFALHVFGKNVDTVEGYDWQRHRRITAPAFNERKNNLVWLESLRQAVDMRDRWVQSGPVGGTKVAADTRTLSLVHWFRDVSRLP